MSRPDAESPDRAAIPDHVAARLEALEFIAALQRVLEAGDTFSGRLGRLVETLVPRLGEACRVEALDGDGEPVRAGSVPAQLGERLVLPLVSRGRQIATLTLAARTPYGPADRELAAEVADRAAVRLDAVRLLESESRARHRTEALQGVTSVLSVAATPEQVGQAVAEHGARALDSGGGAVYALDAAGEVLELIGSWGYDEAALHAFRRMPLAARTLIAEAARERRVASSNGREDALTRYPDMPAAPGRPSAALCAVPLLAGGELLGAVGVGRHEARAFLPAEQALLAALGQQAGLALERSRLYRRQQRANDRLHRLQTTTAALARALTPREVAATAAEQGAEALGADSAWVAVMDESGRSLELAHSAGHTLVTQERFRSLPLDASLQLAQAARTLAPLWLESALEIFGPFPRFVEVRPQAQAAALLPLAEGGAALGAIGLVFDHPRTFGVEDRDYLIALSALCGQALGRARRYQTEHDVASTLQQALLPEALPAADGLELAVRYVPATDDTEAGGDFYEAVELPGGRLGVGVGDIVGHGPAAAAAMGQLRSALRAYALEGRPPSQVLQLLSRYADGVTGARGATLVYAVVDPAAGELVYACAGHPPPLLVLPDGATRYLEEGRGVPLDRSLAHRYDEARVALPRGATLVLYSDGAIERRGEPLDIGLARLAAGASANARLDPEALCTQLLGVLFAGVARRDDVALLALRTGELTVAPLRLKIPARADQLSGVRRAMRAWLAGAGVGGMAAEDLVLASGELVANAVEHAYEPGHEGPVEVELAREPGGTLTLLVRDRGRWRAPAPPVDGMRGRGLMIVRALMHALDVDEDASGTTVSVRFQPDPGTLAEPVAAAAQGPAVVTIGRIGPALVVTVTGEVDSANAGDVAEQLAALAPGPLVVNLAGVGFLASAGMRVLFELAHTRTLAVVAPPDAPYRRALDVARLERVARVTETLDAALARLGEFRAP